MSRSAFTLLPTLSCLMWVLTVSSARAEAAIVHLKKGGTVKGELMEYVPGNHITLGLPGGKTSRITSNDLASVELNMHAPPLAAVSGKEAPPPVPPLQADDSSRAALIQGLMAERADWQARNTDIALPIVLGVAGVAALGTGIGLQFVVEAAKEEQWHWANTSGWVKVVDHAAVPEKRPYNGVSIASMVGGGLLLSGAIVLWAMRTSADRRDQELQRIDKQLTAFGVQASLTPWFMPRTSQRAGTSAGLTLSLTL